MVKRGEWEEAQRCPMCDQTGVEQDQLRTTEVSPSTGKPVTIHTFHCENSRCVWNGTGWIVQVNDDGTIPKRKEGGLKAFPQMPGWIETAARDHIRQVVAEDGTPQLAQAWREREGEDIDKMK
jgi:hypothetical protein